MMTKVPLPSPEVPAGWFSRFFIRSVQAMLLITAGLKLAAASGAVQNLDKVDAVVWFLSMRQLMMVAALAELGAVAAMVQWPKTDTTIELIASCGCLFLSYRVAGWLINASAPCGCLGNLGTLGDSIAKVMLGWMLLGSLALITYRSTRRRALAQANCVNV